MIWFFKDCSQSVIARQFDCFKEDLSQAIFQRWIISRDFDFPKMLLGNSGAVWELCIGVSGDGFDVIGRTFCIPRACFGLAGCVIAESYHVYLVYLIGFWIPIARSLLRYAVFGCRPWPATEFARPIYESLTGSEIDSLRHAEKWHHHVLSIYCDFPYYLS